MKIQSLSISVPATCGNECKFCVAQMHADKFTNQIEANTRFFDLYERDYIDRMAYARDNGCNSVMLTGDGEPLLNREFLKFFANCNRSLAKPFRQIELQTSGMLLDDEYLRFLRNTVKVSIISLSLSSLDSEENANYNCPKNEKFKVDIAALCAEIKRYDFTLRLSLNMTDYFDNLSVYDMFAKARILGANQLTFRVLYSDDNGTAQSNWVKAHACSNFTLNEIKTYINSNGRPLNLLPFGSVKYSVDGISVVLDEDCMSTAITEDLKYLVLRPDCKLYSHWNDVGSRIF